MNVRAGDGDDFARALGRQVARHGDRPLVTWYGAEPGERVELSWKTFANWVAKTANLLVEELGVQPGDRVATLLPAHWQEPVVLVACWLAGATAVPIGRGVPRDAATAMLAASGCHVAFVHEELLAEATSRLGTDRLPAGAPRPALVAITADLLGRGAGDLGDALPFARAVTAMPDHFDPEERYHQAEALLIAAQGGRTWSQGELLAEGAHLAGRLGVSDADRLYSGLGLVTPAGVTAGLALPLAAGVGVVLEAAFRPDRLWRRLAEERVALALVRPDQARALDGQARPEGLDLSRLREIRSAEGW